MASCCDDASSACGFVDVDVLCLRRVAMKGVVNWRAPSELWIGR